MRAGRDRVILLVLVAMLLMVSAVSCRKQAVTGVPEQAGAVKVVDDPGAVVQPTAKKPVASTPRTTVRFTVNDYEVPAYEPIIAAFEEENADLHIELVSINEVLGLGAIGSTDVPEDAEQRLAAAADVLTFAATRETVSQGLLRDLMPLIETDGAFAAEEYVPGSLEAFQWQGGTWSLPTSVSHRLLFFNKDAFDQAGVPYPESGWSWDDLRATAKAVTVGSGDDVAMWGLVWPDDLVYRLIEARVGGLVDYDVEPAEARFDDPAVAEALRWVASLHQEDGSLPYVQGQEGDATTMSYAQALIDKGQAAIWPDMALLWTYRQMQGNIGVVAFPVDEANQQTTPAWVNGVSMSAGTTQPEAAWRWMVYLSQQAPPKIGQAMQQLPASLGAAEVSGYWQEIDPEMAEALRYALDHGYVAQEAVGHEAFTQAVRDVLGGEMAVVEALDRAQRGADEALMAAADVTPAPTFVVEPGEDAAVDDASVTTISFVPGLGSLNLEPYRALAKAFNESHPDIQVEVKMLDLTTGAAPSMASLAQSADCFQWYPSLQDPKAVDAIISLEPFLEADETISVDDFYPQLVDGFVLQDQVWGLPADATPFVIEYNRVLFDAAGLDYPKPGWTWDEFLDMAVALTYGEGEAKQYGFVAEVFESGDLLLMLERLGASFVDNSGSTPKITLNDPTVVEALSWYTSLSTDYAVKPFYVTDLSKLVGMSAAYLEREGLVNDGHAAMWTKSGTTAAMFGPRTGLEIGMAPLPVRSDGQSRASLLTTSGYFISAETPNRLACWQWLTYLTEQPTAVQGYPARISLAESAAYRQLVGEEQADAYGASIEDAATPSGLKALDEDEWLAGSLYWLYQANGDVLSGEMSAQEALDAAQAFVDDYELCVVAGGDYTTKAWQACMQQTDPSLPSFLFPPSE